MGDKYCLRIALNFESEFVGPKSKKTGLAPKDSCNPGKKRLSASWLHYGMSLRAAINLLGINDFIFVGSNRAGNNAFFIKKNYAERLSFDLPDKGHLEDFVDWRVRESRDAEGNLSYLTREEAISIISDCQLVSTTTLESVQVKQLIN